ncbi:hypothetical protein D3C79_653840 [compost metagenome]
MLRKAVMTDMKWPADSGITWIRLSEIDLIIPVPDMIPTKMPAAKISRVTAMTLSAYFPMTSFWSLTLGKFTKTPKPKASIRAWHLPHAKRARPKGGCSSPRWSAAERWPEPAGSSLYVGITEGVLRW